jgi:hypothetical protein
MELTLTLLYSSCSKVDGCWQIARLLVVLSTESECTCSRVASRPVKFLANPVDCRLLTQCPVLRFGRDDLTGKVPHRLCSVVGVWELVEMLRCACTTWRLLALTSLALRLGAYGQWRPRQRPIRPVLKHGPRSLTCTQVFGLQNPQA